MPVLKVHASACESEPMVQSEDVRADFVARLKKALSHAGIPEWGAGARLAEIAGRTAKAASKWLNGEAMPGRANMIAIASALKVRTEWLQYSDGDMLENRADASSMASAVNRPSQNDGAASNSALIEEHAAWLADIATPRSREVLARIASAARTGRLTDEDLNLLDQIAARFEARSPAQGSTAQGSHKRLRDRLQKNDPNPQQ